LDARGRLNAGDHTTLLAGFGTSDGSKTP